MKKIIIALAFIGSSSLIFAQDLGVTVSMNNYFPMGSLTKTHPVSGVSAELTWWNPDKGFPVIGLIGFGLHYDLPGLAETVEYTNASGVHSADVIRHSKGWSTRYAWEVTQPIKHLSVYAGLGATTFFSKLELKTDSPLGPTDYVTDAYGNSWNYYDNTYNSMNYGQLAATIDVFAGASYELPKFNLFGQLGFNYNGDAAVPFPKAIGLNLGIFVPLLRR